MSPNSSEERSIDPLEEVTFVEQRNDPRDCKSSAWDTYSFDRIGFAFVLLASVFFPILSVLSFLSSNIPLWKDIGEIALATIAAVSAVFALLSVRESVRTRKTSVAPELLVGVRGGEKVGVVNIGEGPAHELSVDVSVAQNGEPVNQKPDDAVVLVDDFHSLNLDGLVEEDLDSFWVDMTYASGVGQGYTVTRKVTGVECVENALANHQP